MIGIIDIIFPKLCVACGKDGADGFICRECMSKIHFLKGELSAPVGTSYSRLFSAAAYDGPLLTIVRKLKYSGGRAAENLLPTFFTKEFLHQLDLADCIVPVPLHWTRYVWRAFNQSLIIARYISKVLHKPLFRRAIVKRRRTPSQVGLGLSERTANLAGAFSVPNVFRQTVSGQRVLLVDDVVTSGATADECARVLMRAGAAAVDVLTLAKTL